MFGIHCVYCNRRYLIGTRSITSFHNTGSGPVAEVTCPHGHELMHHFWTGSTTAQKPTETADTPETTKKQTVVAA